MMEPMVRTTSAETTTELANACSARVFTASSTASLARSDLGLNSFWSSELNSPASRVSSAGWAWPWVSASAMA